MSDVTRYSFEAEVVTDVEKELDRAVRDVLDALIEVDDPDDSAGGRALTRALASLHYARVTLEVTPSRNTEASRERRTIP